MMSVLAHPRSQVTRWARQVYAMRAIREVALAGTTYLLYSTARDSAYEANPAGAFENALEVINFELAIGVFNEAVFQQWMLESARGFVYLLNLVYVVGYVPLLLIIATILYRRNRELYVKYRTVAFVGFCIAALSYELYPLAPPRMLPSLGFVDTLGLLGPYEYHNSMDASLYNPYAAMPSMHLALVFLIAIIAVRHAGLVWKVLSLSYLSLMLLAIVVTGNHYWVDALAAAGVIVLSFGIYRLVVVLVTKTTATSLFGGLRLLTRRTPRKQTG